MAHITLRRDDGGEFKMPNKPVAAGDGKTGIISISRPYAHANRRHTIMHVRVPVDKSRTLDFSRDQYEVVAVLLNTAPHILTELLASARRADSPLDLTRYQALAPKRRYGRAHSLNHTRASKLLTKPVIAA